MQISFKGSEWAAALLPRQRDGVGEERKVSFSGKTREATAIQGKLNKYFL